MTDKTEAQPEALRLAARLDCDATDADMGRKPIACTRRKAAEELRRQHAEIQQLKAQLSARQAAPEGWRLVPVEPTEEMLMAYSANPCNAAQAVAVYRAMASAAPPPPERETSSRTGMDSPITPLAAANLPDRDNRISGGPACAR